jgi:hypothetical protein
VEERSMSNASKLKKPSKPKANKQFKPVEEIDDNEIDALTRENEKLITQLLEFTDEMDTRMVFLKKKDKLNITTTSMKSNGELQSRISKLSTAG